MFRVKPLDSELSFHWKNSTIGHCPRGKPVDPAPCPVVGSTISIGNILPFHSVCFFKGDLKRSVSEGGSNGGVNKMRHLLFSSSSWPVSLV